MEKYDVGIVGVWSGCNYGSIATYYALNQVISSMGKSVLMIDKPITAKDDVERTMTHSRRFANEHYQISKQYSLSEMDSLNDLCDAFIIGSDQVWNYGISKNFGRRFYLDFANADKRKIAYAASFGHGIDFAPPEKRAEIAELMARFDGISVREADGVKICGEDYGIKAVQVLDPVFLANPNIYDALTEKSDKKETEKYLVTYILDPTPEKRAAILHVAEKLGNLKVINMLDGLPWKFEDNKERMNLPNCVENLQVEDWLNYIRNAEFVITDSCHGASFALIFKKNFIAITNKARGFSRFKSLSTLFRFQNRLVTDPSRILTDESLLEPLDYKPIDEIMESERTRCYAWLKEKLFEKKKSEKELQRQNVISQKPKYELGVDVRRCQMVAAMLRDYGIKYAVISSGTRHVELVRFLEKNDCFQTFSVVDERSAAFFALGLSKKLNEPVAVCCTSGTASSNYLSAVSEAFYQHVPLIFITADRYPEFLNQREDQMVPQPNMYGSVCLKSVTLPTKDTSVSTAVTRRLISEAIIEATHRTYGPVHINVPISTFNRHPLPDEAYDLKRVHFSIIQLTKLEFDRSSWKPVLQRLATSKVLVVYGQADKLNAAEQKTIDEFSRKFNCVFCVDALANMHCEKSVNVYNLLKGKESDSKTLKPDIVITMNGSSVSGINGFVKKSGKIIHWDIAPNGVVADPYRAITRVFECTPMQFFKRLNYMAGDVVGSTDYYERWHTLEAVDDEVPSTYSQKYAVCRTIMNMPDHSLLHLANSNTIRMACSYKLKENITVYCNRGTNGIDGSASSFMGQVAVSDELCFLLIGDLSFFYDMNSLWNKNLKGNIRIMLFNNSGAGLLKHHGAKAITYAHDARAEGWVKSLGFTYLSSHNKEEFDKNIERFVSDEDAPMFFEVFC